MVWPVGAVSNMMREKRWYSGRLDSWTTLAMLTASSTPGGSVESSSPGERQMVYETIDVCSGQGRKCTKPQIAELLSKCAKADTLEEGGTRLAPGCCAACSLT